MKREVVKEEVTWFIVCHLTSSYASAAAAEPPACAANGRNRLRRQRREPAPTWSYRFSGGQNSASLCIHLQIAVLELPCLLAVATQR